jgi:hypothetical protein
MLASLLSSICSASLLVSWQCLIHKDGLAYTYPHPSSLMILFSNLNSEKSQVFSSSRFTIYFRERRWIRRTFVSSMNSYRLMGFCGDGPNWSRFTERNEWLRQCYRVFLGWGARLGCQTRYLWCFREDVNHDSWREKLQVCTISFVFSCQSCSSFIINNFTCEILDCDQAITSELQCLEVIWLRC